MESTILGQKRVPKVRKMSPEIVPGRSGSPLGPPWEIFRNNGWLKYGFGEDFDRQKGGQEGPKGRPGEAQDPPQSAFLGLFFDVYSETAFFIDFLMIFYRFWDGFWSRKRSPEATQQQTGRSAKK